MCLSRRSNHLLHHSYSTHYHKLPKQSSRIMTRVMYIWRKIGSCRLFDYSIFKENTITRDSMLEIALVYLRVATVSSVMCLGDSIFILPKLNFISGDSLKYLKYKSHPNPML